MSWQTGTAADVADLMAKLNSFLLCGHALEPVYSGVGTGVVDGLIGTQDSILETITVTFTSDEDYDVSGSQSGSLGSGTVGTPFASAVCSFTAVEGGTPWDSGDTIVFTMTPPWTAVRAVGGSEYIWMAPGNDGISQIYVGVLRFSSAIGDYDNLRLGGFTGFDSGQTFANQPNACTRPVLPLLRVGSMPYWFVANGRRVVIVVKVSTNYESAYLGFLRQYANPSQYPYPLVVGGSMSFNSEPAVGSTNWRWSYVGDEHHAFPIPYPSRQGANYLQLRMRRPDGVWLGFSSDNADLTGNGYVWPYGFSMTNLLSNLDGSYPLFPVVLMSDDGFEGYEANYPSVTVLAPQMWGELDGVLATTGYENAAENVITVGRTRHLVVQDIHRGTRKSYFAVALV